METSIQTVAAGAADICSAAMLWVQQVWEAAYPVIFAIADAATKNPFVAIAVLGVLAWTILTIAK